MIFIAVKFTIRAEHSDEWTSLTQEFTTATRAEPGNIFFEWSASLDVPHQFVLLEAFADGEAGGSHVNSAHFKKAMAWMPDYLAAQPDIISREVDGDGWGKMGELEPRV